MAYSLGIDLGTTSVKICLVDNQSNNILASHSKGTASDVEGGEIDGESLQDVDKIYQALTTCINKVPQEMLSCVRNIGICGQMHGVVYWKQGEAWQLNLKDQIQVGPGVSYLHTWQDSRCSPEFLESLPRSSINKKVNSGYGCATTFWYLKNNPNFLDQFDRCGSVMDFLVCMLLNLEQPVMTDQNAMSFGYFNADRKCWDLEILENAGFPIRLLPKVVSGGSCAGELTCSWLGVPAGASVTCALGDFQCSVMSTLEDPTTDGILNISTSAQLAFVLSENSLQLPSSVDLFPYFQNKNLAVAASLNGGNVLNVLASFVQDCLQQFGVNLDKDDIWRKIVELGETTGDCRDTFAEMQINPLLFGERHSPEIRGSVTNIRQNNLSFESVVRGTYKGLVKNISNMMPSQLLKENGISRILASGSVIIKHQGLQDEIKKCYDQELILMEEGDSSYGAALVSIHYLNN